MVVRFGKYVLLKRIATGGMAELFLARQVGAGGFEKLVVVKRILEHLSTDRDFVGMFLNEGRLASSLSHPNIVPVYDLGQEGGAYFMAMEFIAGHDLYSVARKAALQSQPIPPEIAARILVGACAGLHHAHTKKNLQGQPLHIVHRDVSPANILISYEGEVKVTDFGIAKADAQSVKTRTGVVKGKFSYMSPEQIRSEPLDGRSDVFALGVTLHETLAARRLFKRDSELGVMHDILGMQVPPPSSVRPGLPKELDAICARALEKDRAKRYQSAQQMQQDLEAYLSRAGKPAGTAEVAAFMLQRFAEEHAAYQTLLARLSTADPSQLAMFIEEHSELARNSPLDGTPGGEEEHGDRTTLTPDAGPPRPRRKRGLLVAGGLVLAAGIAGAVLFIRPATIPGLTGQEAQQPASTSLMPVPPPVASAQPQHEPEPEPGPEEAPPAKEAEVEPAPPPSQPASHARARARVSPSLGMIQLSSEPSAEVLYQRKPMGTTPATLRLPVGRVELTLVNRELALTRKVEVDVPRSGVGTKEIAFRKGKLAADVKPWADVYVGAKKLGTTPFAPRELYEGTYVVKLVNSELGAIKEVKVTVTPGATTVLREELP